MSNVGVTPTLRSDPRLLCDDVDIKFSRTLNSYKLPQIRHASIDRLAERLTDLRFLSIDFLATFLLTYRVFTTSQTLLNAVKHVYYQAHPTECSCAGIGGPGQQGTDLHCPARVRSLGGNEIDGGRGSLSSPPPPSPGFPNCLEFSQAAPKECAGVARPQAERPGPVKPKAKQRHPDDVTSREPSQADGGGGGPLSVRLKEAFGNGSSFRKYERPEPIILIEGDVVGGFTAPNTPACILVHPKTKLAPIASCETLSESLDQIPGGSDDSGGDSSVSSSPQIDDCTVTPAVMLPDNIAFSFAGTSTRLSPNATTRKKGGILPDPRVPTPRHLQVPTAPSMGSDSELQLLSSSDSLLCSTGTLLAAANYSSSGSGSSVACPSLSIPASPHGSPKKTTSATAFNTFRRSFMSRKTSAPSGILDNSQLDALALSPTTSPKVRRATSPNALSYCPLASVSVICPADVVPVASSPVRSPVASPKRNSVRKSAANSHAVCSASTSCFFPSSPTTSHSGKRLICTEESGATGAADSVVSQRCSNLAPHVCCFLSSAKVCSTITSCRHHKSSTTCEGSWGITSKVCPFSPKGSSPPSSSSKPAAVTGLNRRAGPCDAISHITPQSYAATVRILTILEHWIQKHLQDFITDEFLRSEVAKVLEDIASNCNMDTNEHKRSCCLLKILAKNANTLRPVDDLGLLLAPPRMCSKESFNTLSPLQIAEQMTYLDHQIFRAIRSEELLNQSWMKPDKAAKAPHILLVSKRFNEASRLVVNEIVCRQSVQERAACIEKWALVADICQCMHNYNGVLQICAAFVNSAVYRLKKTWEKISKQTRQLVDRLQALVSSDGRFKNMRDALHRCDQPCIPYLGMYLTDLSFIEEGTANITEDGLINFSKMRMITQVIMEIQHFQQMSYQIEYMPKVTSYLLDTSKLMEEDETYNFSLEMEPRVPRLSVPGQFSA